MAVDQDSDEFLGIAGSAGIFQESPYVRQAVEVLAKGHFGSILEGVKESARPGADLFHDGSQNLVIVQFDKRHRSCGMAATEPEHPFQGK